MSNFDKMREYELKRSRNTNYTEEMHYIISLKVLVIFQNTKYDWMNTMNILLLLSFMYVSFCLQPSNDEREIKI